MKFIAPFAYYLKSASASSKSAHHRYYINTALIHPAQSYYNDLTYKCYHFSLFSKILQ